MHVAPRNEDARRVLSVVSAYCHDAGITYKHLVDEEVLKWLTSKYAPKTSAGKFVTIYPDGERELDSVLTGLSAALAGFEGPEVLGDLRFCDSILHVRYGAYRGRLVLTPDGECRSVIRDDVGRDVPDEKPPYFDPPKWAALPDVLKGSLERHLATRFDFPYRITGVCHLTACGGVYKGIDGAGKSVVLKEARVFSGIDLAGRDAQYRLRAEYAALDALKGVRGVPDPIELLEYGSRSFLVMQAVPGDVSWRWIGTYNPLFKADSTSADRADYVERAGRLVANVENTVKDIHDCGLAVCDFHPGNLLITRGGDHHLVDFEAARPLIETPCHLPLGAPGFVGRGMTPEGHDTFALNRLKLWLLAPFNNVWHLVPETVERHYDYAMSRFGAVPWLPARAKVGHGACAKEGLSDRASQPYEPLMAPRATLRSIARGIAASVDSAGDHRLFPGDIRQLESGPTGLFYGAAGVLWALTESGVDVPPSWFDWLWKAASEPARPDPGLATGLSGAAVAFAAYGQQDRALDVLTAAMDLARGLRSAEYARGLTGVALAALEVSLPCANAEGLRYVLGVGAGLSDAMRAGLTPDPERAGLMHGASGPALLFSRLYDLDGDPRWLDRAEQAIGADLACCVRTEHGTLEVDDRVRTLAYLERGAGGIGLAMCEVMRRRPVPGWTDTLGLIGRALAAEYVVEPQLLNGRAGLLAVLAEIQDTPGTPDFSSAIRRHIELFSLHQAAYRGEIAFLGDRCLGLSMDYGTGSAGILLALGRALRSGSRWLPGLSAEHRSAPERSDLVGVEEMAASHR